MKKKIIALLSATALLALTGCSSGKTKDDASSLFNDYQNSYASYVVDTVDFQAKEAETGKQYVSGQQNNDYDLVIAAKFASLRDASLLKYGVLVNSLVANFYANNPLDEALAKQYDETLTYDIDKKILTVTYEGSSSLEGIDNAAFAFSYYVKYTKEGLVTKEVLFASFVQQENDEVKYSRAYRSSLNVTWKNA